MDFSKYKTLEFERRGRILYIILNQPDLLNAVTDEAHGELSRVFSDAADDADSDIIVLTGAGRAFSAGGDLGEMMAVRADPTIFYRTIREGKRLVYSLLDCDKPVICKVNGDAMGLGATLALLCDVVFASEKARFADPHNNVGFITGDGGQVIWPQLIGYGRAKHYLLSGDRLDGRKAADIGLIHAAVPAEELDAAVDAYADRLAAMPSQSLRWTKATVNIPLKQLAHGLMDTGLAYEGLAALTTKDILEAINAFAEKRKPKFVGH